MKRIRGLVLVVGFLAVTAPATWAQADLEHLASGLAWREVGPTIMGGRVADVAVVESNPSIFYVGAATGGVWKTVNHGTTFEPIFEDQPTASIGDVTLSQSNPNIVWVGTGEPQNRQSSPWGNGVYKSTDGGRVWTHMGLSNTHHISRIQIHHTNPDVVYVAAVGHLWGPNPERGVYRTMDGGKTWELVLFVDENTGAIDLAMDPNDAETIFAAMYQRRRTGYGFSGGGPGSGIYRTSDGGDSWDEMTEGLPEGNKGRIGLSIYRQNSNIVFAIVEARPGQGVYRSVDRGLTWEHLSDTNNRPMYYSQIRVDPNDPERIYTGGSRLYRSSDGGKNFTPDASADVHLDHHAIWIDPANSDHLILAGDGGVSITWDRGENWRQLRNLPISQFYEIGFDMREPYHVCGGLQDNGSWCAPSNTLSNQGIRTRDWYNVGGGDGFYTVLDPNDPHLMFAESQGGNIAMFNRRTMERTSLRPAARPTEEEENPRYRWNWDAPIVQSVHDLNTVYIGSNHLHRSRDRGWTWEEISPDLTKQIDRDTLEIMGEKLSRPLLSRNDGISSYGNITTVSESRLNPDLLYVGTDDGNVHVTRDGGQTWTDLTGRFRDLPERTYVSRVVASGSTESTVYATFDGHRNDDFAPHVFVSNDYGRNWRRQTNGLPDGWSVNVLYEHPRNGNLLFVGNEIGAYFSIDRGEHWSRLSGNLPTVPVDDIQIHPRDNDLVIGTHGRGIWIMDDITPLEELSSEVLAADAHLFTVQTAMSYNPYRPQGWTPSVFAASNPPDGAAIRYYLRTDVQPKEAVADGSNGSNGNGGDTSADTTVSVIITDNDGSVIRTLEGPGSAGLHEVIWDLRFEPPYVPEERPQQFGGFFRGAPRGPKVLPGTYSVEVNAGGLVQSGTVEVRLDPRVEISQADLMARQDLLMSAYRLAKPTYEAGRAVRRLNDQLNEVQKLLREMDEAPEEVKDEAKSLRTEVSRIQRELGQAGRGRRGSFAVEASTTRPTADQLWQLEQAWEKIPSLIEDLNTIIAERMPAFYRQLNEHGIRPNPGEPVAIPVRPGG